ncbi:uncharacterized protein [Euwallacea fornicatus]
MNLRDEGLLLRCTARVVGCSSGIVQNAFKDRPNRQDGGKARRTTPSMGRKMGQMAKEETFNTTQGMLIRHCQCLDNSPKVPRSKLESKKSPIGAPFENNSSGYPQNFRGRTLRMDGRGESEKMAKHSMQ